MSLRISDLKTLPMVAERIAKLIEWTENCPFETDGVYECCATEITAYQEHAKELAAATGDESLIETVNGAVDEDEYGEHFDDNRSEFWRQVAVMASEQPEAPHNEGE